jgi:hypothetical protein
MISIVVSRSWIHVAVADGCERFNTEEERGGKRAGNHFANARSADRIGSSEEQVDGEVDGKKECDEPRPA